VIGVGYDGTAESQNALRFACRLAGELETSIELIAVAPPVLPQPGRIGHTEHGYGKLVREHLANVLEDGLSKVPSDVSAVSVLEDGDPGEMLSAHGVELDLLVIGSRGYGPLRRTLLGGVSAYVMRTAPCPVIVVPRGGAPAPPTGEEASAAVASS
jgi:nucleotide-binding universal stress UspA family protein